MRIPKLFAIVGLFTSCLAAEGILSWQTPLAVSPQDASKEIASALRSGASKFAAKRKTSSTTTTSSQSSQAQRPSDAIDVFNAAHRKTFLYAASSDSQVATTTTAPEEYEASVAPAAYKETIAPSFATVKNLGSIVDITDGLRFREQAAESPSEALLTTVTAPSPSAAIAPVAPQPYNSLFDHPFIRQAAEALNIRHPTIEEQQLKHVHEEQEQENERQLEEHLEEIEDHRYQQAIQYQEQHPEPANIELVVTTTKDSTFSNIEFILTTATSTTTTTATTGRTTTMTTTTTTRTTMITTTSTTTTRTTTTTIATTTPRTAWTMASAVVQAEAAAEATEAAAVAAASTSTTTTTTRAATTTKTFIAKVPTHPVSLTLGTEQADVLDRLAKLPETAVPSEHVVSLSNVPMHPVGLALSAEQANVLGRLARLPVLLSVKGKDQRRRP